jgi:hypothetical protein
LIDWQPVLARLEADPDIDTPAGRAVLSRLLSTGQQYEAARQPDVLYESTEHQQWSGLRPSERLNRTEPQFYVSAYYARPFAARSVELSETEESNALAPAKEAIDFWFPRDQAIAMRIADYYLAKGREEKRKQLKPGPTAGGIQQSLLSSVQAAEAWLAS